ncbi:MAG: hypothetical protein KDJ99_24785 [Candidatus Competibacteraceae bacterium]|nr:hypothetical protein [Candidatus Competibacteraceae bacterium]
MFIRNRFTRYVLFIFFAAGLAACSLLPDRRVEPDYTGITAEPAKVRLGTIIYQAPKCPFKVKSTNDESGVAMVLLNAAIPVAAEFAINYLGQQLAAATKGRTGQFLATGLAKKGVVADTTCFIIARGLLGKPDASTPPIAHLNTGNLRELNLAAQPAFYLEIEANKIENTITMKPVFLLYGETIATHGSDKKFVTISLAFSNLAITDTVDITNANALALFAFDFGQLEVGKYYTEDELLGVGAAKTVSTKLPESFNLNAVTTEAEEPSVAIAALSKAFDNNKAKLTSALSEILTSLVSPPLDEPTPPAASSNGSSQ